MMLALFVSVAAGYHYYTLGGVMVGLITGVGGLILHIVYAYIRSGMTMRDPIERLAMAVGNPSAKMMAEAYVCALVLPLVGAFLASLIAL